MGLTMIEVDAALVRPNAWNPNVQTPRVSAAVKESIERFGYIDPVLVRRQGDLFEIIDGEHRFDAAVALGHQTVEVVVIDATDDEAKRLTVILNETRGQADVMGLAVLLDDLSHSMDLAELQLGLPYTDAELEDLIKMAEVDWQPPVTRESTGGSGEEWHTIVCRVPGAARTVVEGAFAAYWKGKDAPADDVAWGLFLEAVAADWLAGTH